MIELSRLSTLLDRGSIGHDPWVHQVTKYIAGVLFGMWLFALPAWADEVAETVTMGSRSYAPEAALGAIRPEPRQPWSSPAMAWDDVEGAGAWTQAALGALRGPAAPLVGMVPADIHAWCPAYPEAGAAQRAAFWAGLVSSLAYYESTHNPQARGNDGPWFGLLQIVPATARFYGCEAGRAADLVDGAANVRCGLRIMATTVLRDGVISQGMQGIAADWGPFHSTRKREGMRDFVLNQAYCIPQTRPEMRPDVTQVRMPSFAPQPRPDRG